MFIYADRHISSLWLCDTLWTKHCHSALVLCVWNGTKQKGICLNWMWCGCAVQWCKNNNKKTMFIVWIEIEAFLAKFWLKVNIIIGKNGSVEWKILQITCMRTITWITLSNHKHMQHFTLNVILSPVNDMQIFKDTSSIQSWIFDIF